MTSEHIQTYYEEINKELMDFVATATYVFRIMKGMRSCSEGFTQLFSDKTVMSLESTGLVPYPMHVILLNVSDKRKKSLIGSRNTMVGFPQVYCTQKQLEEE